MFIVNLFFSFPFNIHSSKSPEANVKSTVASVLEDNVLNKQYRRIFFSFL